MVNVVSDSPNYVEICKDDSDNESNSPDSARDQDITIEEGGVITMPPSPKLSKRCNRNSAAAIICTFLIGFILGAVTIMFTGGVQFGGSSFSMNAPATGTGEGNDEPSTTSVMELSEEQKKNIVQEIIVENESLAASIVCNCEDDKEVVNYPKVHGTKNQPIEEPTDETQVMDVPDLPSLPTAISSSFTVLQEVNHDATSFTQGLSYGNDGKLYETTGLNGQSKVRRINPDTFEVEQTINLDYQYFGEGSTYYTDANGNKRLVMITWKRQTGFIYDPDTLQMLSQFQYTTTAPNHEGWGITYDETNQEFIVSDGSQYLYFWDRDTLAEKRRVTVTRFDGSEQRELNELELMGGLVCCNIWHQDTIICVDPSTGRSAREYDMSTLWPQNERNPEADVLNGIAIGVDHVLITGKKWSKMFKVVFPDWPMLFSSDEEPDSGHGQQLTITEEDSNAVSYNFLRTTKGSETMRLLLDEIIPTFASVSEQGHSVLSGPRRALTRLSELMKSDSQILSSCHPLAHNLGRFAYQYFGGLDQAYDGMLGTEDSHLLRLCNAAYLHGVIEFHLRDVDLGNLVDESRKLEEKVCNSLTNVHMGPWECRHGIGHGIIQRYRLDAEKDVIQKAINTCRQTNLNGCENGMWMDHFAVSGNILAMERQMMAADVILSHIKTNNEVLEMERFQLPPLPSTLQICRLGYSPSECLIYAATEYLLANPRDYTGALSYCTDPSSNLKPPEMIYCTDGVGNQVAKENMSDFSVLEEVCQSLVNDADGNRCFKAGLSYYKMNSGHTIPREAGLCDNLMVYKDLCMGQN